MKRLHQEYSLLRWNCARSGVEVWCRGWIVDVSSQLFASPHTVEHPRQASAHRQLHDGMAESRTRCCLVAELISNRDGHFGVLGARDRMSHIARSSC
jgi:hypothetical protein